MSATITGVGSGFDIDSWVSQLVAVKENSLLTPLETKLSTLQSKNSAVTSLKGKYSALQSALQTFTKTIYNSSSDMWSNTTINSSNSAYATAITTGNISASNVNIKIEQIATSTVAKSNATLGAVSQENIENTKFSDIANSQAKIGKFTMFLNGKEFSIEIEKEDTVQNIADKIYEKTEGQVQAKVDDNGNFSIAAYKKADDGSEEYVLDENAQLVLGSSGDTSNFAQVLKLHEKTGAYKYSSSYPISLVNIEKTLLGGNSGIDGIYSNEGKITINGVDFEINEKTTLGNLITRINGNSDSNVIASYDALKNEFILTSTQTGETNISLSQEGTNLLEKLNLLDSNGNIASNSQTLGQNAIVYINDNKVISNSNTITGESSGISNLSITVKKPTSDYTSNPDDEKEITLDIERDFTKVKEALNTFVTAYNDVVQTTKNYSSSTGAIGSDSSLNSVLNQIRKITTTVSSDNEGMYTMLSQIGISTSSSDITKLSIDESKLEEALTKNFDSVKNLLSDGFSSKEDTGLFDELLSDVNLILDTENGYFANKSNTLNDQIKSMNNRIDRANTRLLSYEARITAQFNRMDTTIASLNSQLSTFASYFS